MAWKIMEHHGTSMENHGKMHENGKIHGKSNLGICLCIYLRVFVYIVTISRVNFLLARN